MRLTTNEKLVARQSKIARYTTYGGLAVLLGAVVVNFFLADLLLSYASLFVGFILAYIGAMLANKWIKEPRADHALEKGLKGFDNKHHLFNYLSPLSHFLITPTGVLVFKVKLLDGTITCVNGKWNRPWKWSRLFGGMGQEALGDPIAELNTEIAAMKKFLADKIDNAPLVPVDGYVVFTDPRVDLSMDDPALPVVKAEDLKETLRKNKRGAVLLVKTQEQLEQALSAGTNGQAT